MTKGNNLVNISIGVEWGQDISSWVVATPLPHIDRYLLAIRWAAILGISVIILGTPETASSDQLYVDVWLSPLLVLPIALAYNILVSIPIWQQQPLARGRVGWLLTSDLIQATLFTMLTGGSRSVFFILFPITIVEAALTLRWQLALGVTIAVGLLHLLVVSGGLRPAWDSLVLAVVVAKTFVILILGALVTLFSWEMRRSELARRQAAEAASRTSILNEIFLRLSEGSLEPERILEIILDGTQVLSAFSFSLVLLPGPDEMANHWQVAASTTSLFPVGKLIPGLDPERLTQTVLEMGAGTGWPLPAFAGPDAADQLVCGRLSSPTGETLGLIVVGRQTGQALGDEEQNFLRMLAIETGLALRNAQLYAREQHQVSRLRQFEELQSVFFSAISHELKTPLTVLKTLAPSLRQLPDLPPQTQTEIIERIEQNLTRLELLITDLLESSRLEANAVALHPRPVNLLNRIHRVLDTLSPVLKRKEQQVHVAASPNLPRVWAEGKRVDQILSNLMNNAAKFAPRHSTIEIALSQAVEAVQVCVLDAGPGVPVQERERIFDKFYIAAQDKALAGVGLGLFICRELVRLHGGSIWLEDRPEGGSRFCFTLPVANEDRIDYEKSRNQNINHR